MEIESDIINERLIKSLLKLSDVEVVAGITDGEIAKYAIYNEFGTNEIASSEGVFHTIPPRPFMQPAYDQNEKKYNQIMVNCINAIIGGADVVSTLSNLGAEMHNDIKDSLTNGKFTPNAPSTIKKKGSSRPLKDSGEMSQSIRFEVRSK